MWNIYRQTEKSIIKKTLFYLTIFVVGAIILVIEILGTRILAPFYGSTVFVWSSLITITMAALALGYFFGGKIADRCIKLNVFVYVLFFSGVFLTAALFLDEQILVWSDRFGLIWGPLVAAGMLFSVPLFLLGIVSPYAVKMKTDALEHLGGTAGNLYALSTIGALFGGLLSGFYLAPRASSENIISGLTIVLFAVAGMWMLVDFQSRCGHKKFYMSMAVIACILTGSLLIPQHFKEKDNNAAVQQEITIKETTTTKNGQPIFPTLFTTEGIIKANVVYQEPSEYGDIVVFDYSGNVRCFLIDGVNESCWNFNKGVPSRYTGDIAFLLKELQKTREIKDVLVIGTGGGTLLKYLNGSGLRIDGVEINPKMEDVAERFFILPDDLDYNITIDDGRHYLNTIDKKYDAIVMDICFVNSANVHLWTDEFYALLKEHLNDPQTGVIIASRGMISGNPKMERLDHLTANAFHNNFEYFYTGERYEEEETFYMGFFVASDKTIDTNAIEQPLLSAWEFDAAYPLATDARQGELLELVLPATEAILEQSKTNFGERLLFPM